MRAVDTSDLVRYYLRDDPAQARRAGKLLSAGDVFVPKTVGLELERVLRSVVEQPAGKVLDCLAGGKARFQAAGPVAGRLTAASASSQLPIHIR